MVSRKRSPNTDRQESAGPRAKALGGRLPAPLTRALSRFRAAEADFDDACTEQAALFRIDDRYAVLLSRATDLLSRAAPRPAATDDEAQLAAARTLAEKLSGRR